MVKTMTENKLTDKEIIKALECCIKAKTNADCEALKCPFYDNEIDICMYVNNEEVIYASALDLINRQQAEIERLKEKDETRHKVFMTKCEEIETARAEAIKEFWSRLQGIAYQSSDWSHGEHPMVVELDDAEEIYEEMVGEDK